MLGSMCIASCQLKYQLAPHRCGELITSIGGDHETARPADDGFREGAFKIIADRPAAAGSAQQGKTVDDDTCLNGISSGDLYGDAAPIICTVGRQVDHLAKTLDIVRLNQCLRKGYRVADGITTKSPPRLRHQTFRERLCRSFVTDHRPWNDDFL